MTGSMRLDTIMEDEVAVAVLSRAIEAGTVDEEDQEEADVDLEEVTEGDHEGEEEVAVAAAAGDIEGEEEEQSRGCFWNSRSDVM
jgi:hypothetical protein